MPTSLVYELILNLAENGEFEKANALFHNRFFQREEGGTNVRQVWLEVQVQQALARAQHDQCSEAVKIVDHLGDPVPDLAFTHDGLDLFLRSARMSFLKGKVYKTCNLVEKADANFKSAAEKSTFADAVWAWTASQQLPNFDASSAKQKLENILKEVNHSAETASSSGWWLYHSALLHAVLGDSQQADKQFRDALLSPDLLMTYHQTRLAMSNSTP
jgi:hypothetical protein